MTEKPNLDKVLDKIRKLLALATSANEHEAALANQRAHEIMAEYNLSLSDVADDTEGDDAIETDDELQTSDSRPWRRGIGTAIAKLYFCHYHYVFVKTYTNRRRCGYIRRDKHVFVGAKHNIAVCKLMFEYLVKTVDRLAVEGSRQIEPRERTAYITSFRTACSIRLANRIVELYEKAKAGKMTDAKGTTLPALANLYDKAQNAIQAYHEQKKIKFTTPNRGGNLNSIRGSMDGKRAGDSINLNTQLSGGKAGGHLLPSK